MTEEIKNETTIHIREARILGKEYGLEREQIEKLEVSTKEEQKVLAKEFKFENDKKPKALEKGALGRRIAQRIPNLPKENPYFKNTNN